MASLAETRRIARWAVKHPGDATAIDAVKRFRRHEEREYCAGCMAREGAGSSLPCARPEGGHAPLGLAPRAPALPSAPGTSGASVRVRAGVSDIAMPAGGAAVLGVSVLMADSFNDGGRLNAALVEAVSSAGFADDLSAFLARHVEAVAKARGLGES